MSETCPVPLAKSPEIPFYRVFPVERKKFDQLGSRRQKEADSQVIIPKNKVDQESHEQG
jgi:hypothetical protein